MLLRRGSLLLAQSDYARHFNGLDSVVLLRDGSDLLVLPVHRAAAGGYILKLRNAAGDRIVSAADFFRSNGICDEDDRALTAVWDEARAALRAAATFA